MRGEDEFGLGPADVARVVVVGDRPPRSRRCADSGRPSPSRAAPSTPQPSTPSRRPQLNSWKGTACVASMTIPDWPVLDPEIRPHRALPVFYILDWLLFHVFYI